MRPLALTGLALLLASPAVAQQTDTTATLPDSARVVQDAEAALDDLDRGAGDAEQLADVLAQLAEEPLDVNTAPADELAQVPALSPLMARRIVRFRQENGPFGTLSGLRAVEGMTGEVFGEARPYLTASPSGADPSSPYPAIPSLSNLMREVDFSVMQRYTRRLDLGAGYDDAAIRRVTAEGDTLFRTRYRGGPARLYTRLRARSGRNLSLALTLDKDPGERFGWEPGQQTFGYDHVSGHAAVRDIGRLKTLVAGDFTAAFGQGVMLWRSSSFGKGRQPVRPVVRGGRGLTPYSSAEENRFFRGLAATVRLTPRLDASAFVSRRRLDASLTEADTLLPSFGPDGPRSAQVSTLAESGLHRTPTELAQKDALGETLAGGALQYESESVRIGVAGYHAGFDNPIQPDTTRLFRRFDFAGQRATAASLFGQIFAGDYLFFGEATRAPGGAFGGMGGVLAEFRFAEAVVLARHFPRDFTSLHGYAFGERNGATQNETGFYTGLRLQPARQWTLKGYFDLYRFPWVRFATPRPSKGHDARLVVEHEPRAWLFYYLQLRSETREAGADFLDPAGRPLDGLIDETRQSARLHVDYQFSDRLRLRSRVEGVRYAEDGPRFDDDALGARRGTDYGLLLYQDVRWLPFGEKLRLDARLAFFDTDDYAARVYAYENDLLYAFSVPALSGRGRRFYLLARYAPTERVVLEAKYAATHFRGVETVGSGLTETDGPRRREVRAQVRLRF